MKMAIRLFFYEEVVKIFTKSCTYLKIYTL